MVGSGRLAEDQREQAADVNVTITGLTPEVIDNSGDSLEAGVVRWDVYIGTAGD